ncbi:MAG: cysteine desulfurase NifS, partial [Oscillospiraceae bacterium]|nr:cysteine desulfurase NifS [Oscillospiraceae bacterium]
SHVLLAMGIPHEVAHGSLRLTLSTDTTQADVDKTINDVTEVVDYLRNMSPVWEELQKGEKQYVIQ